MARWVGGVFLVCLGMTGCAVPVPVVFTVASPMSAPDVHRCVTERLVEHGFRVVESRREDGILKAERQAILRGGRPITGALDVIDVAVYERRDGRTGVQYTAAYAILSETPKLREPTDRVRAIAERLAEGCSD
ncbi:MAG: hypothetical protein P8170_07605 [Gemmatimonadota bacterium]